MSRPVDTRHQHHANLGDTSSLVRNAPHKILVVDDDEGLAALFEAVLEDAGYDVAAVHSGAEAIDRVDRLRPDLILLDIRMPGMDGIETFREILCRPGDSRIIFMTGYAETPIQLARPGGAFERLPPEIAPDSVVKSWLAETFEKSFLLVPQDEALANRIAASLEAVGKPSRRARDPHHAICLFDGNPGSFVILDEPLQDLPPFLVRELSPGIVRLLLSHTVPTKPHPTMPPQPFLAKPFRPDELLETVLQALPTEA